MITHLKVMIRLSIKKKVQKYEKNENEEDENMLPSSCLEESDSNCEELDSDPVVIDKNPFDNE